MTKFRSSSGKKFKAIIIVLLAALLTLSAVLATGVSSVYAAVPDEGYEYDSESNIYIDYSGQGTVINGKVAREPAKISGDKVDVPIYKGKYEAAWYNGWLWHGWSNWSTENYYQTKQNDYETYRGETTTEYNVRERKEYRYKRYETQDVYSTKYYTTYQGTKWYNCWIFLFTSSWSGYGGEKSGYKIVNRYTKSEKSGTKQVMVYDNEWRTSAPWRWAWENKWEAYDSRTTYSYRSREMKWNADTNVGYEQVPLNYSLYNKDGTGIQNGLKWTFVPSISENKGFSGLGASSTSWVNVYYITSTEAKQILSDNIEEIEDSVGELGWLNLLASGGTIAVSQIIDKVFPAASPICLAVDIAILFTEASDYIQNQLKAGKINTYQDLLNIAERENITLVIKDSNYALYYADSVNGVMFTNVQYIQSTDFSTTTKNYVSMRAKDNGIIDALCLPGENNYGLINYGVSVEEITNMIKFSLKYNYPTILPWNW